MKLQAVPNDWARKIIAAGMHCDLDEEGLRLSAVSECLRSMSYLCSAPEGEYKVWVPASSVGLTSMVRRRLVSLWPELAKEVTDTCSSVMEILDSLDELGDMVKLEGGRWLTAPAHAIRTDEGMAVLLGGGPVKVFPEEVAVSTKVMGRVRLVEEAACEGWLDLWEANEWIGAPVEGLNTWSERLLAETTTYLMDAPNDMGEVFIYLCRNWVGLADLSANEKGLHLCRMRIGQMFSYFIGEFVGGRIRRLSSLKSNDEVRRFRFYLDSQANRPVRIKFSRSKGLVKFKLRRRLPKIEARVLLLGWQTPVSEDEHMGATHHVFPVEMLPIVRKAFEGLGVVLEEHVDARSKNNEC